jgi:hypothetical protein
MQFKRSLHHFSFGSGTRNVLLVGLLSRFLVFASALIGDQLIGTRQGDDLWNLNISFINLFSRWDSGWYASIALYGYPGGSRPINGNWAFFPLYPFLMRVFGTLSFGTLTLLQSVQVSGFFISNILFFVALILFYKLSLIVLNNPKYAFVSTVFFAFWPGAFFYSAVYTESLFMTLSLAAFYLLEKEKILASTVFAFLAALTRSSGFLVLAPFLYSDLQKRKYQTAISQTILLFVPYVMFNVFGYFSTNVFPVSIIVEKDYWGLLSSSILQQMFSIGFGYGLFYMVVAVLILIPFFWFLMSEKALISQFFRRSIVDRRDFKYWFLSFGVLIVLIFFSSVYSLARYSILILPLYWVGAFILNKNHKMGVALLSIMIACLILGSILFSTWRLFM